MMNSLNTKCVQDLRPLPELIQRRDGTNDEPGEWQIDPCPADRGVPRTAVLLKHMVVPVQNYQLDRVIRAHEMMHAKVSPGDRGPWLDRGIASSRALVAAEECRVNFLVNKAGFDISILEDGTEMNAGERIAERGDWAEAVYYMACLSGTGGVNKYLTGIRRHKPGWGPRLRRIHELLQKELRRIWRQEGRRSLTSTTTRTGRDPANELIDGFFHTEAIAEYLDRLADSPISKDDLESHRLQRAEDAGTWAQLNVKEQNLTRHVPGGLGKRRIASNMGRNPRRLSRLLTDPQKRIFDRKVKGNGGVVLIDYSGSMSLSEKDVLEIMEAAPGCTVACYSTNDWDWDGKPNLWVLGARGRMTTNIPKSRVGNGVDHPALVWAVQQKQRRSAPIVWVTDGGVVGPGCGYTDQLAMQCIKTCLKSKVLIRKSTEDAVELLHDLAADKRVEQWWPSYFRTTHRRVTGKRLAA